jgi:radical SAM superfamily enzyme YgiQ (UPF0313 family)
VTEFSDVLVLLLSTYDLGRQPFGLASPAAWLRAAGLRVECADLTRTSLPEHVVREADLVAVHLPMHTATRLALPVIDRVRALRPGVHVCCYGLYAPLNAGLLRARGVHTILGGEFEQALAELAGELSRTRAADPATAPDAGPIARLAFKVPDRTGLPPLTRYAAVRMPDGARLVTGYTESSRGCKHRCRHCPIVPLYGGAFRIVQPEIVLADVAAQVAAGARHITFGDPDFFNSVAHARRIVEAVSRECPGVTYDVTIKVEHLLKHADLLGVLRDTGCLFVTSAVESFDDRILERLRKGHTAADIERVVALVREAGLHLNPTFVAFTPWTSLEGYAALLDAIEALALVEHVAPIQLALRLLIPAGSLLLELDEVRGLVGPFDDRSLTYGWTHRDSGVDRLQQDVTGLIGARVRAPRAEVFREVRAIVDRRLGRTDGVRPPFVARAAVPYLDEPWYC